MNLGFILFDYFPFGGLQRDCVKIAGSCVDRGHRVTIFTRTWQGERPGGVGVELSGRSGWTNVARNRNWLNHLALVLPRHGLDGLVGFNKVPGLDVYYGADPCFVARMAKTRRRWYQWLPRYRHFAGLERSVFARGVPTQILLIAPQEKAAYQAVYGTEERFHLLPPNAARRQFTESDRLAMRKRIRRANDWSMETRIVLFVGSDFRRKGLDRAIRSLAALPDAHRLNTHLAVLGQCSPGQFARLAGNLGVTGQVHFLGGRTDAPDWMLAADLMIHPAYSENTGTTLVEALASGLPVLTTSVCGYAFHVKQADGGIVLPSPFSQESCDRALSEMLTSEKASHWRANALTYAGREDLYGCHERAADIIEQTIRRKLEGRPLVSG
jgi:UDP-glucose:(heptosyl)LPS alpha-1,3-glucosyltransferase